METSQIKICYIPGRESSYSRNRVLIRAMQEAGMIVYDCSSFNKSYLRYIHGFIKFLKYKGKCNVIFVGFLGQLLMPFVRLFTRKKIIFDAFISIYQTLAFDRKSIHPKGLLAHLAKFLDRFSCKLADVVFLDTQEHVKYFHQTLGLKNINFQKLLVGSDDTVMFPRELSDSHEFIVHFHGEYQALHGTQYIVEAAKLLPGVKFQMIGKGKMLETCKEKARDAKNINFLNPVTYEELATYMTKASICLGIFGNTQKTQLVIPHKIYEALAMGKPLITAETPASRELLVNEENVLFCKAADAQSLANAITRLKDDSNLMKKIAEGGYNTFQENCTPLCIGEILNNAIKYL